MLKNKLFNSYFFKTITMIDEFDKNILRKLEEDGRVPFSQIADELNVSNTMVFKRYDKLVKTNIIKKISPNYDARLLGYNFCSYTGITIDKEHKTESVIKELEKIPEIMECHYVTGPYSLYLRIVTIDQDDFRRILYNTLDKIEGISKSESMMDLGCAFKRNIVSSFYS